MHKSDITAKEGTAIEVFTAFLKLGLTSFGGPIAHLGYFRDELVIRRRWLSDSDYADLVALCQFIPGPASSQVGFALGMTRAGWLGGLAAFVAFTLPSALILLAFGLSATKLSGPIGTGGLHGLKVVAVAIVAQAVWGMARSLCPDRARSTIAVLAVAILAALPGAIGMICTISLGALAGMMLGRGSAGPMGADITMPVTKGQAGIALAAFAALLCSLPLLADLSQGWAVLDSFYRAGSLVFGGGHVVLPLLEAEVVSAGWVSPEQFLAGYGAAQAVPGPLFSFAAYLGAVFSTGPNGVLGAAMALLALFLPGFLLLIGALPFWNMVRTKPQAQSAMQGANAAVVGILAAALYTPVFTSAIVDMRDFALGLACFVALTLWKAQPWLVVLAAAAGGIVLKTL